MILVLLFKFDESQESLLGFQLCQRLVQEGHDLLVTTTSTAKWLENEIQRAKELSESARGSITLVQPKYRELENPSTDWIANLSGQYFRQLYDKSNVDTIIGMLPGTSQTAVELKEALECKLVLLGTTKVQSYDTSLEHEFISLVKKADEMWSVGPDTYHHYQAILEELGAQSYVNHKEILLRPQINNVRDIEEKNREQSSHEIVSIWNKPISFFHKGKKMYSNGNDIDSFSPLGVALGKINSNSVQQTKWKVYGLKFADTIIRLIKSKESHNKLKLKPLGKVPPVGHLNWNNISAFVVPDIRDESFNFIALCTMWLGIPTLMSDQSSLGKFLLSLSSLVGARCIVPLTGNFSDDSSVWEKKIKNDILSKDARPIRWAKELSDHLRNSGEPWKLDSIVLHKPPNIDDDVLDITEKVRNWNISTNDKEVDNDIEVSSVSWIYDVNLKKT